MAGAELPSTGRPSFKKYFNMSLQMVWKYKVSAIIAVLSTMGVAAMSLALDEGEGGNTDLTNASYFTILLTVYSLLLMFNNLPPDLVMLATTLILRLAGIITSAEAWRGFSAPSVLSIGVLFIVAQGLEETGSIEIILKSVLGQPTKLWVALARLCFPVAAVSAFLNNTPVVAMMITVVEGWGRAIKQPPSKLLMPLSFASMLGGMCTLLGTSTNLVLAELMDKDGKTLGMFDMAPVTTPCAVLGVVYLMFGPMLLLPAIGDPEEEDTESSNSENSPIITKSQRPAISSNTKRQYAIVFRVNQAIAGKTPQSAGLLAVRGATISAIVRANDIEMGPSISPPGSPKSLTSSLCLSPRIAGNNTSFVGETAIATKLQQNDRIIFYATSESIPQLRKHRGLIFDREVDIANFLGEKRRYRCLLEVIVDPQSPLCGNRVTTAEFAEKYGAVPVATRKEAEEMVMGLRGSDDGEGGGGGGGENEDIGHDDSISGSVIKDMDDDEEEGLLIEAGDTLLIEAHENFYDNYKNSSEFALVRTVERSRPPRQKKMRDKVRTVLAGVLVIGMVTAVAAGLTDLMVASSIAAFLMVATQCLTIEQAFKAVKGRTVLTIVVAFGIGKAIQNTKVAEVVAQQIVKLGPYIGPVPILLIVFTVAVTLGCVVSNNATVILMYPVASEIVQTAAERCQSEHVPNLQAFVNVLIIAASASFLTPISYQTNLMVFRPGGYSFGDFTKFGFPVTLILGAAGCVLAQYIPSTDPAINHIALAPTMPPRHCPGTPSIPTDSGYMGW